MHIKFGDVEYIYHEDHHLLTVVSVCGNELKGYLCDLLSKSQISTNKSFSRFPYQLRFIPEVKSVCVKIFESISLVKGSGQEELAARAASYLFEAFSRYWIDHLLGLGKETVGIQLWREILSITLAWEDESGIRIHKGTPYFFLAESYILTGERDLGFLYLYNAIDDDKALAKWAPSLNYPDCSPAYLTATMRKGDNQMDYLVEIWRQWLNQYIDKFNRLFCRSFTITEFDNRFLNNKELSNVVYFFVFNFISIYEITNYLGLSPLSNEFFRLKMLDLIFNLALIIDETLKEMESKSRGESLPRSHYISNGILWLCGSKEWIDCSSLQKFWNKDNLNVANGEPDDVIPQILPMNKLWDGKPVRKEVFPLLIAYNLRNYGGHNIRQQSIFTSKYDEIIEALFMSLFLCIDN